MKMIEQEYIHEIQTGNPRYFDRIDLFSADEDGNKSQWLGAFIRDNDGKISEVGDIPADVRRNLINMMLESI